VFGLFSPALAVYSLSLDALDESGVSKTQFEQGEYLYLDIVLDNQAGVAGAAFTLNYDPAIFTPPGTNADGTPVNPNDIISSFPFSVTLDTVTTDTHRENSSESGKIYFSGAAIDTSDGGAKYDTVTDKVLFTVKLQVNGAAALGNTDLSLTQTELFNLDAGYGTDNNGNGTYEAGDLKDKVPVLVGALDVNDTNFGGDLSDDFPILLGDQAQPLHTLQVTIVDCLDSEPDGLCDSVETNTGTYVDPSDTGTDPNNADTDGDGLNDGDEVNTHGSNPTKADSDDDGYDDPQEIANGTDPAVPDAPGGTGYDPANDSRTYDIAGSVIYDGSQTGTLYVKVYDDAGMNNEIASTQFATPAFPQPYDFTGLEAKAAYYLLAFIDGAGGSTGAADPEEGQGSLEVAIALDMTGSDVTAEDPSPYWQTIIHAEGQDLGGVKEYNVTIGVAEVAETLAAPPAPPEFTVKMELRTPNWDALSKDLQQVGEENYSWILAVNPHGSMGPPTDASATISWDPATFSSFNFYQLREGFDGTGAIVVADMRTTTQYTVTGVDTDQYFTIEYTSKICVDVNLVAGWNLVSLPVTPDDPTLTALFPDATVAYKFEAAYQNVTSLEPGLGYWVKVTNGGTYTICGQNFPAYTATLSAGWHLRGAVNGTATPTTDPANSISVMYGFDNAYFVANEFVSGLGYWVKISEESDFTVE